jgi:hypothetical protein
MGKILLRKPDPHEWTVLISVLMFMTALVVDAVWSLVSVL